MALPYRWQYRVDRWKQIFGGIFGSGEKRPQLCPACGALVGINATRCHECGAIMVRNGSCYKCVNCGSTSGCS